MRDGGTLAFEAPETQGGPHSPFPLDLWSLGVSIYACMFGRLPFNGPNLEKSILEEEFNFPEGIEVSQELEDLLIALLKKDPKERPTIV